MRKEEFKEIGEKHIEAAKEIIKLNGDCLEIGCENCPFDDTRYCNDCTDEETTQYAIEFLKVFDKDWKAVDPNHYKMTLSDGSNLEVIEVIKATLTPQEFRGFLKANVIKYVLREKNKNGVQDLKKANKYLEWLIFLDSDIEK